MRYGRQAKFESLEDRALLAVTAAVTAGGDLVVQGTADGAVEIAAVSAGAYRVTDNGVVVADSDVLTGVTDDIRISLADGAAAVDSVSVDLGGQTVDQVEVKLGKGDNSFSLTGGAAESLSYRGGAGADVVQLDASVEDSASLKLGAGDNSVTVTGALGRLDVQAGDGADSVSLAAASTVDDNVKLNLGSGDNSATISGAIGGSLAYDGRAGNDSVTIEEAASIADAVFARLGAGDNVVTHAGSVGGDFHVVSANADDTVDIADTATVGGETTLGLGEQRQGHGGGGHCGGGQGEGGTDASESQIAAVQAILKQIPGLQAAIERGVAGAFSRGFRR